MAKLDFPRFQQHLAGFDFTRLFVEVLGWNNPPSPAARWREDAGGPQPFASRMVAELGGVAVLQVVAAVGWPDEAARQHIWRQISQHHAENLLIFTDQRQAPSQSQWYWVKRGRDEATGKAKNTPRRHDYFRGQPVDLFASKLQAMVVELAELDNEGRMPVLEAARRIRAALDVETTTKRFFTSYSEQHTQLLDQIEGIADERDRRWYASVILNRLMFVWFLQKKFFLDGGNTDYLLSKLAESRQRGADRFFGEFLNALFFEAFAKAEGDRSTLARQLTGQVPYLNGGLFLHHKLELDADHRPRLGTTLRIPDAAFEGVFNIFAAFTWHLDDTPGGDADEINPDVLGYIFEKYINQKAFGAYYTRPEITGYLAERSIHQLILERVHEPALPELGLPEVGFDTVADLLARMDARTALKLVNEVLPSITVLDPAVGSGAFLVAALKCLINVYYAVVGRAELGASTELQTWLRQIQKAHPSVGYYIKRRIVTDNLYGVDIMEEASEIAKLRLFLAMVASVRQVQDLEPLPNIDFNILAGNSLVGLMRVDEHEFDAKYRNGDMFRKSFRELLEEKNRKLATYRAAADTLGNSTDLRLLRDDIDSAMAEANQVMNELLQDQFATRGIKYEQATWDAGKGELGKPKKRTVTLADVAAQHPLHWGYVFDEIIQKRGGFDIVLANPPWEVFQTDEKEFFTQYDHSIQKNKLRVEEWKQQFKKLNDSPKVRLAWLRYVSGFAHMAQWFKRSPDFRFQTATKINLYLLFVERCFGLLRQGGHCGIVVPAGLYSDLGAKGMRDLLFDHAHIQGLFCFENRKAIFEGVDSRFKFIVLTFEKTSMPRLQQAGETNASAPPDDLLAPTRTGALGTTRFPAAFMRHNVDELERFPGDGAIWLDVELVKKLSPEAHAVMEFKDALEVEIAKRLLRFPLLGASLAETWNLKLSQEFNMTTDSDLFKTSPAPGRLPLWEGKQLHQFNADFGKPRYWLSDKEASAALMASRLRMLVRQFNALGISGEPDPEKVKLNHTSYRLAFRDVGRNTDERTMIATVLPPNRFCPHTVSLEQVYLDEVKNGANASVSLLDHKQRLFLVAGFNSYVFDWYLRQSVTAHVSFFFVYNTPMPRLMVSEAAFALVVGRSARLICVTPEFDALAKVVGLRDHRDGATDPTERARLRAEIDGLVAHLYGLTEAEFVHILATFPLVPEPAKQAARNAYRDVERGLIQ